MTRKIFISSTFRDMKTHREEIWKRLQNLDIDILGMERFGARKSSPIETCLEEVSKCDIYIGIISMNAGTIDPTSNKSYTELEYQRAIELDKDILIYLIDEAEGNVLTKNIDFENSNYLVAFKHSLKKHTVDFFKNESDLGDKIFKRLSKIIPVVLKNKKRPNVLDCKVYNFKSSNFYWSLFLGNLNNRPYELFSGINSDDYNGYLLPESVNEGKIIKSKEPNGIFRFDFQYINKHGYRTND